MALYSMGFDLLQEWVMAYKELENPSERLRALEKVMEYTFPKVGALSIDQHKELELEELDSVNTLSVESTDKLLEALDEEEEP